MTSKTMARMLRGGSALPALALAAVAGLAAPAFAQDTTVGAAGTQEPGVAAAATPNANGQTQLDANQGQPGSEIVVTGTLLSRRAAETATPVAVLGGDYIEKTGIPTIQGVLQTLSSNNGPALTNSFTANGAFAGGASSISLRGLTTNSTLVLFDGLRAAYYPLADDGVRNFVDLNTIPDAIVDHIEVVEDGASSTYGADAVAGVVNIITKKTVVGFHATADAGVAQRGYLGNQRVAVTYGYGDLQEKGYNFYISGHYLHSDPVYNSEARSPFNSDDQTDICHKGVCGSNLIANASDPVVGYTGFSTATSAFTVRPYDATNTTALGRYQLLNGCGSLTPYTLTDKEYAANPTAPRTVCQEDIANKYNQIEPRLERWGISGRATVRLGGTSEAYLEGNYEHSFSSYTGLASIIRGNVPAGIDFPAYSTSAASAYGNTILTLPTYICPRGTTVACTAANGTLNPNNPFASLGEVARLVGRLPTSREYNSSTSQVFRAAGGVHGSFGDDWNYAVDGTAMVSKLKTFAKGYVYVQHLLDEIADGSYNFVNPEATSQAALDYLTPNQSNHATSHLYQGQASLSKGFFELPGGTFKAAIGGSVRYESLNDPSGNPDYNGPTERYFRLNAFGASGHRYVESGYFELDAPILTSLDVTGSGRYDHYSTGNSNFSPKVGVKFTPVRPITLRGTFSTGFRIPSFAENGSLPTTGYVTTALATLPASYINQHLTAAGNPDLYITQCITNVCIGETTVGNPNLKPEKSRNFTAGTIIQPFQGQLHDIQFTVNYYNIRKKNAITSVDFGSAITNYYNTGGLSYNGVTIIQDEVDPDHPDAQRRVAFAQGSFINANTIKTAGFDFGVRGSVRLGDGVRLITNGTATRISYLNTTFPDGSVQHYVGTLGNFNLTAGTGTQRWKATWQNTLEFKRFSLSATAYYTSGYNYSAEDQGSVAGDCSLVPTNLSGEAFQGCNVKSVVFVDLHGEVRVNERFTMYADVYNVADRKPPIDATTYGAYLYNPVVGDEGIIGRSFRVGARVDF